MKTEFKPGFTQRLSRLHWPDVAAERRGPAATLADVAADLAAGAKKQPTTKSYLSLLLSVSFRFI
jgi:hypothetical protein